MPMVASCCEHHFHNVSKISSVRVPPLIVSGTVDALTPTWVLEKIFAQAHQPKQSLTKFQIRYNLNDSFNGPRYGQTLLGGQRSAEHSAALRCHGVLNGASRASYGGRDLRSC